MIESSSTAINRTVNPTTLIIDPEFKTLIPPLLPVERAGLEASILDEGCRDALVVWRGRNILVDGHNRYEICTKHGISFEIVEIELAGRDEAIDWIYQNQLARRNLTDEKRSYLRGKQYEHRKKAWGAEKGGRGNQHTGVVSAHYEHLPNSDESRFLLRGREYERQKEAAKTADTIAKEHGVGQATIRRDAAYARSIDTLKQTVKKTGGEGKAEEVFDKLLSGEIKAAKKDVVTLARKHEPSVQAAILEKVVAGEAKDLREAIRDQVRQQRSVEFVPQPIPDGKYNVILADPPWRYAFSESRSREIENHYPTMDLEEIKALDIPADDDAVLLLWTTAPKLEESLQVLNAWGFTYRTCAVWDKERIGMGYWFRIQHEILLVGARGSFPVPAPDRRISSVIRAPRSEHSRKPDVVHEIIERMFPNRKYLELFARAERPGWDVWGNEV